jgi:hypothetical protein
MTGVLGTPGLLHPHSHVCHATKTLVTHAALRDNVSVDMPARAPACWHTYRAEAAVAGV